MLTGDRVDTACNIAASCGLLGSKRQTTVPAKVIVSTNEADDAAVIRTVESKERDLTHRRVQLVHPVSVSSDENDTQLSFLTMDAAELAVAYSPDNSMSRPLSEVSTAELEDAGRAYDEMVAMSASGIVDEDAVIDNTRATCRGCRAVAALRVALHDFSKVRSCLGVDTVTCPR